MTDTELLKGLLKHFTICKYRSNPFIIGWRYNENVETLDEAEDDAALVNALTARYKELYPNGSDYL